MRLYRTVQITESYKINNSHIAIPCLGRFYKFKILMKLLAIPLSDQRTVAKWLVISETRHEAG